ncbi:D-aminoacyl-tRNA deacylase [Lactobacillus kefiranofaciens]|uniref:D-aminoacyl-tRNA deacylase n=1 Tax=Lactobacillus kefiranofaciens TaxID=267818 RepID=A0AAX3UFI8_9LACO|nr:D-aminoacyl-tRNA deacylase [Lactobacillus kefiranofaciens]AEG40427.1 D-tyrosyl-tRNA(Tyr) deacylase [Lactobacillus kefiranofaciens subsp. kefiranofaciens]KRL24455.1 D-tyrosyl-tRNA(Tyr) deacylase [Lactobacillus kefiranofaciens subsp. kefirgranum DSM 10550 = JCM 8572]KRM22162.1 D-tyrosyl-tRNA(Tyr) deacylase [Lactobacillus kefiranofaciens subsp. kefiranofaciens DSM 5016 = JCM 6985]MCJ2172364.1 D-aminoacyl-tRNA deacylase [Lactobacillus kefiranofaciens]MCP9329903.1 D-tyrosyl-tRNA(Tyr) deacylase [
MRVVIQRVNHAKVNIAGKTVGKIGKGFMLLVGIKNGDELSVVKKAADKIAKMRIFEDEEGKTNLSLKDVGGEILSVSQFTLMANTKKGNRPSFVDAMRPPKSKELWEDFNKELEADGFHVETGEFGADMQVDLENDGPFTIVLDL